MQVIDSLLKKKLLFPLVAIGVSLLLFGAFLNNFFSNDDFRYLENNFQGLKHLLLGYNTLRVVSNVIWGPLYQLFGFNPLGYNLLNTALYALNAILFFHFVERLFTNRTLAFFAGLFFVLSGVGADAVLWKCANNSLLCLCFCLLTLLAYLRFRGGRERKYLLLSLGCYCLAMFSKEEAASLPGIILLIEYLFPTGERLKPILLRLIPYCAIIVAYLLLSKLVFSWLAVAPAELARFYQIRPLYSLSGGFTAFFLPPSGELRAFTPLAYFAAIGVGASLFLVKERKPLLFAFCWVFITFLPQSLTSLGQLDPEHLANSISRYLYMVSIGPPLVYAALLVNLKQRVSGRIFLVMALLSVGSYGWINYSNVQQRGQEWRRDSAPVALYLEAIGKAMPSFPPNSFIFVENKPTGRAFVQQAMRAYYRTPTITWITDPRHYRRQPGERAFLINVVWSPRGIDGIYISEPWPLAVGVQ
jgi:hypothetical protein